VEKYTNRLVAKGIDFGEICSLVSKITSIIFLLSVVVAFDLEVEKMDMKTIFLDRKFGSFCDGYFDALATLCHGYCDESWVSQTSLHMTWHVRRT
jgi:hypothetical protein